MPTVRRFVVFFLVFTASIFGFSILSSQSVSAIAKESTLTVSHTATTLSLGLTPTYEGNFGTSNNSTFSIITDNFTGYSMYISAGSTSLTSSTSQDTIDSISSTTTQQQFSTSSNYNDQWGIKPSHIVTGSGVNESTVSNSDYLPVSTEGLLVAKTTAANNVADSYNYSIGARVDTQIHAGSYTDTIVVTVVANTIVYNVTYDANTSGTPTNMPSPNPQALSIDGGTPTAQSYAALSSNVPLLQDKTFGGWCDVSTTIDSTTGNYECSGITYSAGDNYPIDQTSSATNITLHAIWLNDPFPVVWSQTGKCEFHGNAPSTITGSECTRYQNDYYIDTGIALNSQANALNDYEIHFTIDRYDPSENTSAKNDGQQTFVNLKVPSSTTIGSGTAPGIIVRRSTDTTINIESKMNNTNPKQGLAVSGLNEMSIYRISGVLYYSINSGPLVELQDLSSYNQYFDLSAWFGAYPNTNGCDGSTANPCDTSKRYIEAEFSNMYIRLGHVNSSNLHNVTFNGNGGTPSSTSYLTFGNNALGTLPEVTRSGWIFTGWYTAQSSGDKISSATVPSGNPTYWAHWALSVSQAQISNTDVQLSVGNTETITIANDSDLEPYTLVSNDTSVATINQSTGVITAVANGSTTITMTGGLSGDTRTISVSVGSLINVDFDSRGGNPADYELPVAYNGSFSSLPTPTKTGYSLEGWYTGINGTGTKLTTSTVFDSNTPTQYYANWEALTYVCKIATSLHKESCNQTGTNGCMSAGFLSQDEIKYGSLVESSTMSAGDAYDCDINNDGTYDNVDERFYYFGTSNDNAKFVYYKNLADTSSVYNTALTFLPTASDPDWDNPNLVSFSGDYNNTVARFMTYDEAHALCNNNDSNLGTNGKCIYLLEKSAFANTNITDGIWLEKQPSYANRIQTRSRQLTHGSTKENAPRPTIEVPIDYVEPYVEAPSDYEITFMPHNGDSSFAETVTAGSALGNKYPDPDPTYTDHIFQGWYTAASGGTLVTDQTIPDDNWTYHAQWKGTVALAQVSNNAIAIVQGNSSAVQVTNASELEQFTFSSSDPNVVSVNSSTGALTGVGIGTATISITGTTSGVTNSNIVTVTVLDPSSVFRVTFDPRNGESTFFVDVPVGNSIGTDMPNNPTYTNHVFQRWYDTSNDNTVTSATQPVSAMSVYAEWKLDVTQAVISNNDLTLAVGDQITVLVSNSSQLEPYTFSSSDTSIATVDANTGVITGVGAGTTNIIMTGSGSNLTKSLEVDVTAAPAVMRSVTFNANGGTTPTPYASTEVEDGTSIGSLPTTTKANSRFFGWYTDNGTFYNEVTPATTVDADVTYYAKWIEDTTNFPIVWYETNACTFDGSNNVSGNYCTAENKVNKYINTGIQLFTEANYEKDFEVGFTIVDYTASNNGSQATFVNSKQENKSNNYPGFVVRRYTTEDNIEITEKWKDNDGVSIKFATSTVKTVKIMRRIENIDGTDHIKMYYSINDGTMTPLQDITNVTHIFFDTSVWFGASLNSNNAMQRPLVGTLTDMYIKLGTDTDYTINFDVNDGSFTDPDDSTRVITIGDRLGTLPVPNPPNNNYTFVGWFDESVSPAVQISDQTIPTSNATYVAHYSYQSSNTPVSFDVSNNATRGYQTLIDGWTASPVNISTFNKAASINSSTWGDTSELSELQFWNGIRSNFVNNECLIPSYSDAVKPLDALSAWTNGSVDCSKPDAYDTKIGAALTVRLNNNQGAIVSYAKADNGVIHNMIPGQTYYWEKSDDSTIYGYVTATSNKGTRWVDTGTIRNVRDLGGLPVTYTDSNNQTVTGTLQYGRLFRGEKLNSAPATELTNLGITTEYNVGDEYSSDTHLSDYHLSQVIHYNFDYNSGDENNPNSNYMKAWTAVTSIMTDIVNVNTTKNVYFHCRVGADRTGTVAYLLEGLLGVPDEMRYEEYALSNLSGLYDRTRYYKEKSSTNNEKFVFMMGFVKTNSDIYNWYMHNPDANAGLIQQFRSAMTIPSN